MTVRVILITMLVASRVFAVDDLARKRSPGLDLLEIYRQRCQTEIRTLAAGLDTMEKDHPAPAEAGPPDELAKRLDAAWADGRAARREYRALLEATRKYTRWSRDAKLPQGFDTPARMVEEATRARRWNGLRPVIVPMKVEGLEPGERLGWSDPAGDRPEWQTEQARILEWLLLLRWLAEPPGDAGEIDRDWLRVEAGGPLLERWKASEPRHIDLLHGDYRYVSLYPPADTAREPLRVRHALARFASALESPLSLPHIASSGPHQIPIRERLTRKETVLRLVLDTIRRGKGKEPIALDWFRCGARVYPFLTALAPEGIEPVRVMRERAPADALPLEGLPPDVHASLFRHQIVMRGDGTWDTPVAGWTSVTPVTRQAGAAPVNETRAVTPTRDETGAATPAASKPAAADQMRSLAPANAWSSICQWIVQVLETRAARGEGYRTGEVEYRSQGWYLAFGRDELEEMIAKRWTFPGGVPVDVQLLDVSPHRTVTIRLVAGGQEVGRQDFRIAGPWPGWFAARYRPAVDQQLLFPVFCLLFAALVALRSWRKRRDMPETAGLIVMMITPLLVWVASGFLVPRTVGERGGTVEFDLPVDASVPARLRELNRLVAAHVFMQLCRESSPAATPDEPVADPFLARFGDVVRRVVRPWPLIPRGERTPGEENTSLMDMEYRISGYAHDRETVRRGPLELAHLLRFKRAVSSLEHRGEKSIPPSLDAGELQPASLVVVIGDGDHGGLIPPSGAPGVPGVPLVVLCPTGPGRDRTAGRQLDAASRIRWLSGRASAVSVLEGDGRLRPAAEALQDRLALARADASGNTAQDLDAKRESWWASLTPDRMSTVAKSFAAEAARRFRSSRIRSSRTVLAVTFVPWKLALLLVTAVLGVAFPLWLRRTGLRDSGGAARFAVSLVLMSLVVVVALSLMGLQGVMRSYGVELTEALRCATWWTAIGLVLGLATSVTFLTLARSSPYTRLIRGSDLTWTVTPVTDRLHPWIRATGLVLFATGVAWTLVCPVAHIGVDTRLVPHDLWATAMWGVGFFLLGAALLWHEPRALRAKPAPAKVGPATR